MNAKEFFDKVVVMRKIQKEYFRKRDAMVLKKAKEVEAEIDAEIQRVMNKQIKLEL